ncbi:sensor histidine kinase [Allosalinactinospora lopnorensis]|uniref:sensor histidine kinase n=1 Tax=Allosalinactinospora lopnorensis TaxID=1352348 RepID=UPI00138F2AEE|nr:histidine kinase [Allosalinactinospora lopnorensis]
MLEHLGLLLLLALVCRRSSALGIALAVPAVALAAGVLRTRTLATFFSYDEVVTVVFLLLTFAVANGFSLRSEDRRRVEQVAAARRAERLELARDLHDDVAHHVTAIVVLAQAGQELVRETEFPLRGLFRDVERTGQEGLVSMGRMVAFLRDASDPAAATRHPREEIGTIREQAERFSRTGPPVEVDERPGVAPRRWPPDVATSIGRLVQEGLTNVGKHAPSCTGVRVVVEMTDGALMVSMRNDGSGRRRRAVRSSGHGLTGLAERFDALGGRLTWGETIEGLWELSASVPVNSGDKEGHDVDQRADRR